MYEGVNEAYHFIELCCLGVVSRGAQLISNPPISVVPVPLLASDQHLGDGLQTNFILKEREKED